MLEVTVSWDNESHTSAGWSERDQEATRDGSVTGSVSAESRKKKEKKFRFVFQYSFPSWRHPLLSWLMRLVSRNHSEFFNIFSYFQKKNRFHLCSLKSKKFEKKTKIWKKSKIREVSNGVEEKSFVKSYNSWRLWRRKNFTHESIC